MSLLSLCCSKLQHVSVEIPLDAYSLWCGFLIQRWFLCRPMCAVDIVRWGVWLAWHICKGQRLVDFDFEYNELDLLVVALSLGSMNGTEICCYETVQSLISFQATLTNTKGWWHNSSSRGTFVELTFDTASNLCEFWFAFERSACASRARTLHKDTLSQGNRS